MARIELITEPSDELSEEQRETFDWVVESRGKMIRPFEVLLHTPEIARSVAELGGKLRFGSAVPDHDRELAILTVGVTHGCAFVWDSHIELARGNGVREEALEHLQGRPGELTEDEESVVGFVRELCTQSAVSDERFERLRSRYGDPVTVEMCALVGYYTMLGYTMSACDAC